MPFGHAGDTSLLTKHCLRSSQPRVVLRIGKDGDVGNVELQDLIVLTKGGTAGES